MELNKELEFKVMVTFPHLLEKEVEDYNKYYGTDFEIIETIYDDVPFCRIRATKYDTSNVFGLGYSLAIREDKFKGQDGIS